MLQFGRMAGRPIFFVSFSKEISDCSSSKLDEPDMPFAVFSCVSHRVTGRCKLQ
jgi:hypothetical protein